MSAWDICQDALKTRADTAWRGGIYEPPSFVMQQDDTRPFFDNGDTQIQKGRGKEWLILLSGFRWIPIDVRVTVCIKRHVEEDTRSSSVRAVTGDSISAITSVISAITSSIVAHSTSSNSSHSAASVAYPIPSVLSFGLVSSVSTAIARAGSST